MNFDIKVNTDGTPKIIDGDFVPVTYSEFISQKIYKALMNMDTNIISGMQIDKLNLIKENILDYLTVYFSGDLDVDINSIEVDLETSPGSEKVQLKLKYNGTSPTGEAVDFESDLLYSISSGAALHVNYEPNWLSISQNFKEKEVIFPIEINEVTNEIELPMEPFPSLVPDNGETSPDQPAVNIYLLKKEHIDTIDSVILDEFDIELLLNRKKYQITSYLNIYSIRNHVIQSFKVSEDLDTPPYGILSEYGEPVVVVENNTTGNIKGTAELKTAVQATNQYSIKNEMVYSPLFPMRRRRGRYYAKFPKSIQIGKYYIKYTAISEVG